MNNVQIIEPTLTNFLILEKLTGNEYKSSNDDKRYIIDKKLNKIVFINLIDSKKKFFYKDDITTVDVLHTILRNFKNSVILERYSTLTEPLSHLTLFQYNKQNFYFYYEITDLHLNSIEIFDSTSRQISSFTYNKNHTVIPTISYRYEKIDFFIKDNVLQQIIIDQHTYKKSFITNRFYQHLSSVIVGKITIGEPLYLKSFILNNNIIIDIFQEKKYNIINATQKFLICKRIYKFLEPKWNFSLLLEDKPKFFNRKSYHFFPDNIIGTNASEAENLILNTYPSIKEVQIIPQYSTVTTVILENVMRLFVDDNNIVTRLETPVNFTPPAENPPTQIGDTIDVTPLPSPPPVENPPTQIGDTIDVTPLPSPPPVENPPTQIGDTIDVTPLPSPLPPVQNPPTQIGDTIDFDISDINITKEQIRNIVKSTKKWPVYNLYMKYIRYLNGDNEFFSNLSQKQIKALFINKNSITFKNNISQKRKINLTKKANVFYNFITNDNTIYNFFILKIMTQSTKYSHLPDYILEGYEYTLLTSKDVNDFKTFETDIKKSSGIGFTGFKNKEFELFTEFLTGDLNEKLQDGYGIKPQISSETYKKAMENPESNIKKAMEIRRNLNLLLISNFSKAPTQKQMDEDKFTIFNEKDLRHEKRKLRMINNLYFNSTNNTINPKIAIERCLRTNNTFKAAFMYLHLEQNYSISTLVGNARNVLQNLHRLPRAQYETNLIANKDPYGFTKQNYRDAYKKISSPMKKSMSIDQGINNVYEESVKRYDVAQSEDYNDNTAIREQYEKQKQTKITPPIETPPIETPPQTDETPPRTDETRTDDTPPRTDDTPPRTDETQTDDRTQTGETPPPTQTQPIDTKANFGLDSNKPIVFELGGYTFVLTEISPATGKYTVFDSVTPSNPSYTFELPHNIINETGTGFTQEFIDNYNTNIANINSNNSIDISIEEGKTIKVAQVEERLATHIDNTASYNSPPDQKIIKNMPSRLAVYLNTEANTEFVSIEDKDLLTRYTLVKLDNAPFILDIVDEKTGKTGELIDEDFEDAQEIKEKLNKYNENLRKQLCDPDTKLKEFLRNKVKFQTDTSGKNKFLIGEKIEIDGSSFNTDKVIEKMNVNTVDSEKIRRVNEYVQISKDYFYVKTTDGNKYLTKTFLDDLDLLEATSSDDFKKITILDNLDDILILINNLEGQNIDSTKNDILRFINEDFKTKKKLNNVTFYKTSSPNSFQNNAIIKRFESLVRGKNLTFLDKYVLAKNEYYNINTDQIDFVKLASEDSVEKLIKELEETKFDFTKQPSIDFKKGENDYKTRDNIEKLGNFIDAEGYTYDENTFNSLVNKTEPTDFFGDYGDIGDSFDKMNNLKKYTVPILQDKTLYIDTNNDTFIGEFEETGPKSLLKYGEYSEVAQEDNYTITEEKKLMNLNNNNKVVTLDTEFDKLGILITANMEDNQVDTRLTKNNLVIVNDSSNVDMTQTTRSALNLNLDTGMATIGSINLEDDKIDNLRNIEYDIGSHTTNRNIWETDKNYIVDIKINTNGVIPAVSKISYIFPKKVPDFNSPDNTFKSKPIIEVTIQNNSTTPLIQRFESKEEVTFNKEQLHRDYREYLKNDIGYKSIKISNDYRTNIISAQSSYLSIPGSDVEDVRINRHFFGDYVFDEAEIQNIIDSINVNFPYSNHQLTLEDIMKAYEIDNNISIEDQQEKLRQNPFKLGEQSFTTDTEIKLAMFKNELGLRLDNLELLNEINQQVDSSPFDTLVKLKILHNDAVLIGNLEQEELRNQYIRSPTKAQELFTSITNNSERVFPNIKNIMSGQSYTYESDNIYLKNMVIDNILMQNQSFNNMSFFFNTFEEQITKDSKVNIDSDELLIMNKTFCQLIPYLKEDGSVGYMQNVLDVDSEELLQDNNMSRNFAIYDEQKTKDAGKPIFTFVYKAKDRVTGENVWRELPQDIAETRDRLFLEDIKNQRQFSAIDTSTNIFNYDKQQDILDSSERMKKYEEHKVAFHNSYDNEKSNLLQTNAVVEPTNNDIDRYKESLNKRWRMTSRNKFNKLKGEINKLYNNMLDKMKETDPNYETDPKYQNLSNNQTDNIDKLALGLIVEDIDNTTFLNAFDELYNQDLAKTVGSSFYNWFVEDKKLTGHLDDQIITQHNQKFKNMKLNNWKKDSEYQKLQTNKMIKDNLSARNIERSVIVDKNIDNVFRNINGGNLLYDNEAINTLLDIVGDEIVDDEFKDVSVMDAINEEKTNVLDRLNTLLEDYPEFRSALLTSMEEYLLYDIREDLSSHINEELRDLQDTINETDGSKNLLYRRYEPTILSFIENKNDDRFNRFLKDDGSNEVDIKKLVKAFEKHDLLLHNLIVRSNAYVYRVQNVQQGAGIFTDTTEFPAGDIEQVLDGYANYMKTNITDKLQYYYKIKKKYGTAGSVTITQLMKSILPDIKPFLGTANSNEKLVIEDNKDLFKDVKLKQDDINNKNQINNHMSNIVKRFQLQDIIIDRIATIENGIFNQINDSTDMTQIDFDNLEEPDKKLINELRKGKEFTNWGQFKEFVTNIAEQNTSQNTETQVKEKKIFKEFITSSFELKDLEKANEVRENYRKTQLDIVKELQQKNILDNNILVENLTIEQLDELIREKGFNSWEELMEELTKVNNYDKELYTKIENIKKDVRLINQLDLRYGNLLKDNNFEIIKKYVEDMEFNKDVIQLSFDTSLVNNKSIMVEYRNMEITKDNVINFLKRERIGQNNKNIIRQVTAYFNELQKNPSVEEINKFNTRINKILKQKFQKYQDKKLFSKQLPNIPNIPNPKITEAFVVPEQPGEVQIDDLDESINPTTENTNSTPYEDRANDDIRQFDDKIKEQNKILLDEFNKYQIIEAATYNKNRNVVKDYKDNLLETKIIQNAKKEIKGWNFSLFTKSRSDVYLFKFYALKSIDPIYAEQYLGTIMFKKKDWEKNPVETQNTLNNVFEKINKFETDNEKELKKINEFFSFFKKKKNKEFEKSNTDSVKLLRAQIETEDSTNKDKIAESNRLLDEKTNQAHIDDNVKFYRRKTVLSLTDNDPFFKYSPPSRGVILKPVLYSGNKMFLPFRDDENNPIDENKTLTYRDWLGHVPTQEFIKENGNVVDPPIVEEGKWVDYYRKQDPGWKKVLDQDFVSLDQFDWSIKDGTITATYDNQVNPRSIQDRLREYFIWNETVKRKKLAKKHKSLLDNTPIKARLEVGQPIKINGVYFMKVRSNGLETKIGDKIVRDEFYLAKITEEQMRRATQNGVEVNYGNMLKFRRDFKNKFKIDIPNEILELMKDEFSQKATITSFDLFRIRRKIDDLKKDLTNSKNSYEDFFDETKGQFEGVRKILPKIDKKQIFKDIDEIIKSKPPRDITKLPPYLSQTYQTYQKKYDEINSNDEKANSKKLNLRRKFRKDAMVIIEQAQTEARNKTVVTLNNLDVEAASTVSVEKDFAELADAQRANRDFIIRKGDLRQTMTTLLDDYTNDPDNRFSPEQKAKLKLYFNNPMWYKPGSFSKEHVKEEWEKNAKSYGITDPKILSKVPIPHDNTVDVKYMNNWLGARTIARTYHRATHKYSTLTDSQKWYFNSTVAVGGLALGAWGISSWFNGTKKEDECNLDSFDPETGSFGDRNADCNPLSIQEMINQCQHQSNTDVDNTWFYSINLEGTRRHTDEGDNKAQDPDLICTENTDVDNIGDLLKATDICHQFCTMDIEEVESDPGEEIDLGDTSSMPIGRHKITDIEGVTGLSFDALVERFGIGNIFTKLILGITEQEYNDLLITVENFQEVLDEYGTVDTGFPLSILASKYRIDKQSIQEELEITNEEYNNYMMKEASFKEIFVD